jgi:DNA-binding Lrp family transcriptional regulator
MEITDAQENDVIRAVQHCVPFSERPFAEIGEQVELPEAHVVELVSKWHEHGKLREISAILEGSALGHESALVAGVVPEERLDEVVEAVNAHPTVTHNYLRDHDYNLWYTIAAPVEIGLDPMIGALSRQTGIEFLALRRTATYKIGVNFDLKTRQNRTEAAPLPVVAEVERTPEAIAFFRALQTPAPITARLFDELARQQGVDRDALLAFGREHLGGAIRRYVGTLRHRKLGVRANAMIVWSAPPEGLDAAGAILAQAPEVSHCYARNSIAGFPYTLYSMIHAPDLSDCEQVAARLSDEIGVRDYRLLVSLEEYKKERLRYFLPELDAWWEAHGAPSPA